jgi:hypothetical protein
MIAIVALGIVAVPGQERRWTRFSLWLVAATMANFASRIFAMPTNGKNGKNGASKGLYLQWEGKKVYRQTTRYNTTLEHLR